MVQIGRRRTKIIATLGPATSAKERIRALLEAGADVMRLNFAHGTQEEHARTIRLVRQTGQEVGTPVAVLVDLGGPRLRTGPLKDTQPLELKPGQEVVITTDEEPGFSGRLSIPFPGLSRFLEPGHRVLLDNGIIELEITAESGDALKARVVRGGSLGANKGVNLPNVSLPIPILTDKDQDDLEFAIAQQVDYVAVSFSSQKADIQQVKEFIQQRDSSISVIAKLERQEAIKNLDDLLSVSDGVMVARGDLGVELSLERVPLVQKEVLRKASERNVLSITATQMLESMTSSPRPTRAEVSDVANAILDGTDAVMLSEETSIGLYPVEAVRTMAEVALEVERTAHWRRHREVLPVTPPHALSHAVTSIAYDLNAKVIVVLTRSGYTAQQVSKTRSRVPIIAFTDDPAVQRRLQLWWGVVPYLCQFQENTDAMMRYVDEVMLRMGVVSPGDLLVITGTAPVGAKALTNFIKLHQAGEE